MHPLLAEIIGDLYTEAGNSDLGIMFADKISKKLFEVDKLITSEEEEVVDEL